MKTTNKLIFLTSLLAFLACDDDLLTDQDPARYTSPDLDGALEGNIINENIIKKISEINEIKIQVGGGIRNSEHIKKLLDFGVDKVILGTAAVEYIDFLK